MFDDSKNSFGLVKCQDENSQTKFGILEEYHKNLNKSATCNEVSRKKRKEYSSIQLSKTSTKINIRHMNIDRFYSLILVISIVAITATLTECIGVKPIDFERYIKPCYTGVHSSSYANVNNQAQYNAQYASPLPYTGGVSSNGLNVQQQLQPQYGKQSSSGSYRQQQPQQQQQRNSYGGSSYPPSSPISFSGLSDSSGDLVLGQRLPHGQTIGNFIELVSKIESNHPGLHLDQFIRVLLNRFHYDNYYYEVRSGEMFTNNDKDIRADIIEALLNPGGQQQISSFVEETLSNDEKCSMYFMLSHHIEKEYSSLGVTLKESSKPYFGKNTAASGYPAMQASAVTGEAPKYPGPSPGFGSYAANGPAYPNSNQPSYNGDNPMGMNSQFPSSNPSQYKNYARPNSGGSAQGGNYYNPQNTATINPARMKTLQDNPGVAYEYGVIAVGDDPVDGSVVISRVLLGILAASQPSQQLRELALSVFPNFDLSGTTKRLDVAIDPLFAVTLADLWAISANRKKPTSQFLLGDKGNWNSTMCPTSYRLERSESIKFTTAELNGGLDGLNLGRAIKDITNMKRSIKLSDLLRTYYSKLGFGPLYQEVGVCQRTSALSVRQEELKVQAENYLRLYDLRSPEPDGAIVASIGQIEPTFKDLARQASTPGSVCEPSADMPDIGDQCEISRAQVVAIMDVSPQANQPLMEECIVKVSKKINMWKYGSTMSILTNQMDSYGYERSNKFNGIVKDSSNEALIGCALTYDRSRIFQGSEISDPVRLVKMFEQTFVNMNGDTNAQQATDQSQMLPFRPTPFSSIAQSNTGQIGNGLKNTRPSKSIIWFNFGSVSRPQASPTRSSYNGQESFEDAKRVLSENFKGASILAVGKDSEDLKPFVFEQIRDIFSQAPDSSLFGQSERVSGTAEQLAKQLVRRICESPATFECQDCSMTKTDTAISTGYITPGRKQYWMMSPRSFLKSDLVRMIFKVEGGRLRVCLGRQPRPDETASASQPNGPESSQTTSTNNYYTGSEHGVCKDVVPGQEIEFAVEYPCYDKKLAACNHFYYVIEELGQGRESDPKWICRDEGCRRLDQVKFTLMTTGISSNIFNSAFRIVVLNPCLIFGSIIYALWFYYRNLESFTQA